MYYVILAKGDDRKATGVRRQVKQRRRYPEQILCVLCDILCVLCVKKISLQ